MKTKSSCEKGRDLDSYHFEAPIDDGLMTCRYLMELRKRALIWSIPSEFIEHRRNLIAKVNRGHKRKTQSVVKLTRQNLPVLLVAQIE